MTYHSSGVMWPPNFVKVCEGRTSAELVRAFSAVVFMTHSRTHGPVAIVTNKHLQAIAKCALELILGHCTSILPGLHMQGDLIGGGAGGLQMITVILIL